MHWFGLLLVPVGAAVAVWKPRRGWAGPLTEGDAR